MNSKQQIFFSTKSDIVNMMFEVERNVPIEYVPMGASESETTRREKSLLKFTELGYTNYSNWISLDNRYMVIPFNEEVIHRAVMQRDGSCRYIIDLASNSTGVELSTGGIYAHAEKVLIASRISAFADASNVSLAVYKEISKAMKKCFAKVKNVYVSPEALSLIKEGWRLSCNYNAPCDNDLKLI